MASSDMETGSWHMLGGDLAASRSRSPAQTLTAGNPPVGHWSGSLSEWMNLKVMFARSVMDLSLESQMLWCVVSIGVVPFIVTLSQVTQASHAFGKRWDHVL